LFYIVLHFLVCLIHFAQFFSFLVFLASLIYFFYCGFVFDLFSGQTRISGLVYGRTYRFWVNPVMLGQKHMGQRAYTLFFCLFFC
jgi:hypothetical protein